MVLVEQPFAITAAEVPCLERDGVKHVRHRQYARGHEMNVWFAPPA